MAINNINKAENIKFEELNTELIIKEEILEDVDGTDTFITVQDVRIQNDVQGVTTHINYSGVKIEDGYENIKYNTEVITGENFTENVLEIQRKKPFSCDICDITFKHQNSLETHKRTHSGEKPFSCDVCNKTFSRNWCLVQHNRIHTGEKPFLCDICNKKFTLKNHLILHKRIHTEEKLFQCDICNVIFTRKISLEAHTRLHIGYKSFSCEICNKKFSLRHHLNEHYKIHIEDKQFSRREELNTEVIINDEHNVVVKQEVQIKNEILEDNKSDSMEEMPDNNSNISCKSERSHETGKKLNTEEFFIKENILDPKILILEN